MEPEAVAARKEAAAARAKAAAIAAAERAEAARIEASAPPPPKVIIEASWSGFMQMSRLGILPTLLYRQGQEDFLRATPRKS